MVQTVRTRVDWSDGSFTDVEITRSVTRNTITTRTFTTPAQPSDSTRGYTTSPATYTENVSPAAPPTPRSGTSTASPRTPSTPRTNAAPPPSPASPRIARTYHRPPSSPASSRTPSTSNHAVGSPTRDHEQAPSLTSSSVSSASSLTSSAAGRIANTAIPHPQDLVQPQRANGSKFYVVFSGSRVGIFGNWHGEAKLYTHGISGSHHKGFNRWSDAYQAYHDAYFGHAGAPGLTVTPGTDNLADMLSEIDFEE
ncbi:hypothetical protein BT96DRAFT_1009324 [Gymnopus androsaceus JB14]|uniref:Ribonuclease H1 N-terminal domain-containing protein n=1 Tax=Gymnopus androsaceus JB14 TaxID=1447944 RepID=A0A6A4GD71_9AGAR|nr:hypothetical protein BT96DRAFT_1009324 [Gymnopus androsaceus JB14]